MATHSNVLAWWIPGTEEPGGLPSMGSHRVRQDWSDAAAAAIHWKDWCWSWNSNTLATWCEELTHWKRPWCWERLRAGGEGDNRGWDGWMASLNQWTWVWVNSWRWTGRPGVLQSMGLQSQPDWLTDWTDPKMLITQSSNSFWLLSLFSSSHSKYINNSYRSISEKQTTQSENGQKT